MRPRLEIDMAALAEAVDIGPSAAGSYYLDCTSGAVEMVLREEFDAAGTFADVRADRGRHRPMPSAPAWLRIEIRRDFVEKRIDDPHLRLQLLEALQEPRAVHAFERVLRLHEGARDAFGAHRARSLQPMVEEWLAAEKIRAHLVWQLSP